MIIHAKTERQSNSAPFATPARESYLVFVSSEGHIREVESSPQDQLSFHRAMEDVHDYRSIDHTDCSLTLMSFRD